MWLYRPTNVPTLKRNRSFAFITGERVPHKNKRCSNLSSVCNINMYTITDIEDDNQRAARHCQPAYTVGETVSQSQRIMHDVVFCYLTGHFATQF